MFKWLIAIGIGLFIYSGGLNSFFVNENIDGTYNVNIDPDKIKYYSQKTYNNGSNLINYGSTDTNTEIQFHEPYYSNTGYKEVEKELEKVFGSEINKYNYELQRINNQLNYKLNGLK